MDTVLLLIHDSYSSSVHCLSNVLESIFLGFKPESHVAFSVPRSSFVFVTLTRCRRLISVWDAPQFGLV